MHFSEISLFLFFLKFFTIFLNFALFLVDFSVFWLHFGPLGAPRGALGGSLGAPGGLPERSWGLPGRLLGRSWGSFWSCFGSPNGDQQLQKAVPKRASKSGPNNDNFLIDLGSESRPVEHRQSQLLCCILCVFGKHRLL